MNTKEKEVEERIRERLHHFYGSENAIHEIMANVITYGEAMKREGFDEGYKMGVKHSRERAYHADSLEEARKLIKLLTPTDTLEDKEK